MGEIRATRSELASEAVADIAFLKGDRRARLFQRLLIAAVSKIPVIGTFLAAGAEFRADERTDDLLAAHKMYIDAVQIEIAELREDIFFVVGRVDELGDAALTRAESDEFFELTKAAFQGWSRADTREKRRAYAVLLVNAAGTSYAPDEMVALFIRWLDRFHEPHFRILKHLDRMGSSTRHDIALEFFSGPLPREDTAEAQLFSELYRELNLGGLVHEDKPVDETTGIQYKAKPTTRAPRGKASPLVGTRFGDTKPEVLTALGERFVHYVFRDIGPRIEVG